MDSQCHTAKSLTHRELCPSIIVTGLHVFELCPVNLHWWQHFKECLSRLIKIYACCLREKTYIMISSSDTGFFLGQLYVNAE